MNWKPISEYDKRKRPPRPCVFLFEKEEGRNRLDRTIQLDRNFGYRVCIAYCEIPNKESF